MRYLIRSALAAAALLAAACAHAGNQLEEQMSASVRAALSKAVSDQSTPFLAFATDSEARTWLDSMSHRLERRMPDRTLREDFLVTVHYEAKRAGLDPQMVLGLIQVESAFRKYAISSAGARGLMQVMPFWIDVIGTRETNLFHLRTNLRFGCAILRHYLDMERGDLFRALGRYNGSLGRPEYPNMVLGAWKQWDFTPLAGGVIKTGN
jgi:soluble lytic murein transglycosylase-like protein